MSPPPYPKRGFTEAQLSAMAGIPVVKFSGDMLPHPWRPQGMSGHKVSIDKTDFQKKKHITENARWMRDQIQGRIRAGDLPPAFKKYTLHDYIELATDQSARIHIMRIANMDEFHRQITEHDNSAPHREVNGWRMTGIYQPVAAILMQEPKSLPARLSFAYSAACPPGMLENVPEHLHDEIVRLSEQHEVGHMRQCSHNLSDPYAHNTEASFWCELDADYHAYSSASQHGISEEAQKYRLATRTLSPLAISSKEYWFTPQINGINATFAQTIAAWRELHLSCIFTQVSKPMPSSHLIRRWAEGHNGKNHTDRSPDVQNLRRRLNRTADTFDKKKIVYADQLKILSYLDRHHEFTLPLTQNICRLTIDAARHLMPRFMNS